VNRILIFSNSPLLPVEAVAAKDATDGSRAPLAAGRRRRRAEEGEEPSSR
jgi:hypothetical protein